MRKAFRHQDQVSRLNKTERTGLYINKLCNDVAGDTILAQCFEDKKDTPNEHYLVDFMDTDAVSRLFMAVRDGEGNVKLIPKKPTSEANGAQPKGKNMAHKEPVFKFPGILVEAGLLPMRPANEKEKKDFQLNPQKKLQYVQLWGANVPMFDSLQLAFEAFINFFSERLLSSEVKALTPMLFGDLKTIRVARRLFSKKGSLEGKLAELHVGQALDPQGYLYHGRPHYLHTAANSVRYGAYTAQTSQGDEGPEGEHESVTQAGAPTLTEMKYEVVSPQEFCTGQIVEVGVTIRANLLEHKEGEQQRYKLMPLLTSVTRWVDLSKVEASPNALIQEDVMMDP